jgi:hypothetical protein
MVQSLWTTLARQAAKPLASMAAIEVFNNAQAAPPPSDSHCASSYREEKGTRCMSTIAKRRVSHRAFTRPLSIPQRSAPTRPCLTTGHWACFPGERFPCSKPCSCTLTRRDEVAGTEGDESQSDIGWKRATATCRSEAERSFTRQIPGSAPSVLPACRRAARRHVPSRSYRSESFDAIVNIGSPRAHLWSSERQSPA